MTVMVAEDRSMCVQPYRVVRTAWVDIDLGKLGTRLLMSPEAVEKKFRRLLKHWRLRAVAADRRPLGEWSVRSL